MGKRVQLKVESQGHDGGGMLMCALDEVRWLLTNPIKRL